MLFSLGGCLTLKKLLYRTKQGFQPIRLDYVPYLRQSLLHKLQSVQGGSAEVQDVIDSLDAYGLTKEDLMENLKELQMVLDGDKTLAGIDSTIPSENSLC